MIPTWPPFNAAMVSAAAFFSFLTADKAVSALRLPLGTTPAFWPLS
jgi:hypothetical protein